MGLLIPQAVEVKATKILEDKIVSMQYAIDELHRFKQLHEQSQQLLKDKEKEMARLMTDNGALQLKQMESDKIIYDLQNDLKRMGELETRDIGLIRTQVINTMHFLISKEQAKMIGGLTMFSERLIKLKFDGNTGALIKAITDTNKEFDVPPS